jgi:hypothetical protein
VGEMRRRQGHKQQILILPPRPYSPIQPCDWHATLAEQIQGQITNGRKWPFCDSRYDNLHAGKRPFMRDGARFALRLAGVGLSRLGKPTRADLIDLGSQISPQNLALSA